MSDFQALLNAALIGTSRTSLPAHTGALADALNAIGRSDPEGTLLARAGLAGLAQKAGMPTGTPSNPLPDPAPAETLPGAPVAAVQTLPLVLDTPTLHEWLTLCADAGCHVPHRHLPELLSRARHDTALRELLRPVLGERGAWLAQFNPEWRFTPTAFSEEAWEEATEAEREAIFRNLRAADPPAALELLNTQWKTERAGSKKRLLGVVGATLQPDDLHLEPLLETALSDRSSEVQDLARALLQRLPGSAYNARMAQRLTGMLPHEKMGMLGKLLGKEKVKLSLPDTPDPDLKRDGLEGTNTASARFQAALASTHPDAAMHALSLTPAQLVHLAALFNALDELRTATLNAGHVQLAQKLLPHNKRHLTLTLLAVSGRTEKEIRLALKDKNAELLDTLLSNWQGLWPADLSGEILAALRHSVRNADYAHQWPYHWRSIHTLALTQAHPDAARPAPLDSDAPAFAKQTMGEINATLDLRKQLRRDFGEESL